MPGVNDRSLFTLGLGRMEALDRPIDSLSSQASTRPICTDGGTYPTSARNLFARVFWGVVGTGLTLPPRTAGPGAVTYRTARPGAAMSGAKAGRGRLATNRPALSQGVLQRSLFRRIRLRKLFFRPCPISYIEGLFTGRVYLPGASLVG